MKVLMVLTSHDKLGDTGRKTGFIPEYGRFDAETFDDLLNPAPEFGE